MSKIDDWKNAKIGERIELPPEGSEGLTPKVSEGDKIKTICRIRGEGNPGWLCGPYKVLRLSGKGVVYRPKHAKHEKLALEWVAQLEQL